MNARHPTTVNDVYRKNAWMAVYEMQHPSARGGLGAGDAAGRRAAAWRTVKRGMRNLGGWCNEKCGWVMQCEVWVAGAMRNVAGWCNENSKVGGPCEIQFLMLMLPQGS